MSDQPAQPGQPGAYPPPGYPPQAPSPPQPGYPPQPGSPPAGYPPQAGASPPPGYGQPYYGGYAPVAGAPMPGTPGAPRYAGFWIRFAAAVIDVFVLFGLFLICLVVIIVGWIAMPFVLIGYRPWMWWKKGGTVGQRLLGIRVVRNADGGPITGSQAVIRLLGTIASGAVFYLGYIWAAFEPRKRAWHDIIADTVVIRVD